MIIIAGAIIIALQNTNIIDKARNAVELAEEDAIRDAVLASMIIGPDGLDIQKLYNSAKKVLEKEGFGVGTLDRITKTFIVTGKYGSYTVKLLDLGVEIIKNVSNNSTPEDNTNVTYTLVNDPTFTITISSDINGNLTSNEIEISKDNVTGKYITNSFGSTDTLEFYNITNNKLLIISSSERADVLTTNGIAGLTFENLTGKIYRRTTDTTVEFRFIDEDTVSEVNSNGTETETYFRNPASFNEDKVMIGYVEYSIER